MEIVDNVDNSVDKKSLTTKIAILRLKKAPRAFLKRELYTKSVDELVDKYS